MQKNLNTSKLSQRLLLKAILMRGLLIITQKLTKKVIIRLQKLL